MVLAVGANPSDDRCTDLRNAVCLNGAIAAQRLQAFVDEAFVSSQQQVVIAGNTDRAYIAISRARSLGLSFVVMS